MFVQSLALMESNKGYVCPGSTCNNKATYTDTPLIAMPSMKIDLRNLMNWPETVQKLGLSSNYFFQETNHTGTA